MAEIPPEVQAKIDEMRKRRTAEFPQLVATFREKWRGFMLFVKVGLIAIVMAAALALTVEYGVARPACESWGTPQGYTLDQFRYPVRGGNDYTSTCVFRDSAGHDHRKGLSRLMPWWKELLVTLALEIEVTAIFLFIGVALAIAGWRRATGKNGSAS